MNVTDKEAELKLCMARYAADLTSPRRSILELATYNSTCLKQLSKRYEDGTVEKHCVIDMPLDI
jgi:hypothetical protein